MRSCGTGSGSVAAKLNLDKLQLNLADKLGRTPLYIAVVNGHGDCVQLLIDYGAKVNIKDELGLMPLHIAARNGDNNCISAILSVRTALVNPLDADKNTPLHLAAQNGHLSSVRLLVNQGADIKALNKFGRTPAYLALQSGHELCYKELENLAKA